MKHSNFSTGLSQQSFDEWCPNERLIEKYAHLQSSTNSKDPYNTNSCISDTNQIEEHYNSSGRVTQLLSDHECRGKHLWEPYNVSEKWWQGVQSMMMKLERQEKGRNLTNEKNCSEQEKIGDSRDIFIVLEGMEFGLR